MAKLLEMKDLALKLLFHYIGRAIGSEGMTIERENEHKERE